MAYNSKLFTYSRDKLIDLGRQCNTILDFKKIQHAACIDLASARSRCKVDPMAFRSARRLLASSNATIQHNHSWGSSEEEPMPICNRTSSRCQPWYLSCRDHASSSSEQPLDAPLEIDAQRAENFQRFYRAVVSPSHVRVTAGGRIVPNYPRPPPVYNPNEKQVFDPTDPTPGVASMSSIKTPEEPHDARINLIGDSSVSHHDNVFVANYSIAEQQKKDYVYTMNDHSQTCHGQSFGEMNDIKVSPPGLFDPTKPFTYNGRLVYPVQAPGYVPYPILPGGALLSNMANLPTSFIQPVGPSELSFLTSPSYSLNTGDSQQDQYGAPPTATASATAPALLKAHMQALKATAEFLQHQLKYNEEQIDVEVARTQLQQTEKQIEAMEYGMSTQPLKSIFKAQPEKMQSEDSIESDDKASVQLASQASPMVKIDSPEINLDEIAAMNAGSNDMTPSVSSIASPITEQTIRPARPLRRSHAVPIVASTTVAPRAEHNSARLPPTAAKAPEFKPRPKPNADEEANMVAAFADKILSFADVRVPKKHDSNVMPQFSPWATGPPVPVHAQVGSAVQPFMQLPPPGTMIHSGFAGHLQTPGPSKAYSFQGDNAFAIAHSQYNYAPNTCSSVPTQDNVLRRPAMPAYAASSASDVKGVPYLLGFTPAGQHGQVDSHNFLYSRPLNDAEKRARELYWGKAPKEASRGLPKFDGRDFWIASPVKPSPAQLHTGLLRPIPTSWDLNPSETQFLAELEHEAANGRKPFDCQPSYNTFGTHRTNTDNVNVSSMGQYQHNHGIHRVSSPASTVSHLFTTQAGHLNTFARRDIDVVGNHYQASNPGQDVKQTNYQHYRPASVHGSSSGTAPLPPMHGPHHSSPSSDDSEIENVQSRRRSRSRSKSRGKNGTDPQGSASSYFQGIRRAGLPQAVGVPASGLSMETVTAQHAFGWSTQDNTSQIIQDFAHSTAKHIIVAEDTTEGLMTPTGTENQGLVYKTPRSVFSAADLLRLALTESPEAVNRSPSTRKPKGPVIGDDWS